MNGDEIYRMPLAPFDDKVDSQDLRREWEEWHRGFELNLQMRKVESQHEKLVTMLSVGGRGLQRIFYNLRPVPEEMVPEPVKIPLMPPEVPEYDNAIKRLEKFFVGKRNERVELEVFRSLKQTSEESFNNFILRLRSQASRCEFSDREETEILQQITMGARDEKVRDKGLENSMSLDEIINYAINREVLVKQREKLKPFRGEPELNNVDPRGSRRRNLSPRESRRRNLSPREFQRRNSSPRQSRRRNLSPRRNSKPYPHFERQPAPRRTDSGNHSVNCSRCGSDRHTQDSLDCYAREATCNRCGQKGHYARKCTANRERQYRSTLSQRTGERHSDEANSLASSEGTWKEEIPHRPTPDDVKVE